MSSGRHFNVQRENGVLVIVLKKDLGSLADSALLEEMQSLADQVKNDGVNGVVVDFSHVSYFGSIMLEGLRLVWVHLHQAGGRMALCNLSDVGREIIELANFHKIWTIADTRAEALEAVKPA